MSDTTNPTIGNVITIEQSTTKLCYQFHAVAEMRGESAQNCRRFIILTVLKWVYDKTHTIGFPDDPRQYAAADDKWFASFKKEEATFGVNVSALASTGEWAIRFRFPGAPYTFISRIALKPIDNTHVEVGCQDSVSVPNTVADPAYGFRPAWLSNLLNVGKDEAANSNCISFTQADEAIDPFIVHRLNTKKACTDVVNLWKNPQNRMPFVFITVPTNKQNHKDAAADVIKRMNLPGTSEAPFTPPTRVPSFADLKDELPAVDYQAIAAEQTKNAAGYARVWLVSPDMKTDFMQKTGITLNEGEAVIVDPKCFVAFAPTMHDCLVKETFRNLSNEKQAEKLKTAMRKRNMGRTVPFAPLRIEIDLAPLCAKERFDLEQQGTRVSAGETIASLQQQVDDLTIERDRLYADNAELSAQKQATETRLQEANAKAQTAYDKLKKTYANKDNFYSKLDQENQKLKNQIDSKAISPDPAFFADTVFPAFCYANWPRGRNGADQFREIVYLYCLIHGITFVNDYETKPAFIDAVAGVQKAVDKTNYANRVSFIEKFCDRLSHQLDESKTTTPRTGEKMYGGENSYHFCVSGAGRIFYHFKHGETIGRPCLVLDKYDPNHSE